MRSIARRIKMAQKEQEKKKSGWWLARSILPLSLALLTTGSIFYGGYYYCPAIPIPSSNEFPDKLMYALRCALVPTVVLVVAVIRVGLRRVATGARNPLAGKDHLIQLDKNFLANTLEQFAIFSATTLILITFLNGEEMRIVPLYAAIYVTGRILFRVGYAINPRYRSWGMMTNFVSSWFIVGLIVYFMFTRGFMFQIAHTATSSGSAASGKVEL